MSKPLTLASMLLVTTALVPTIALAQSETLPAAGGGSEAVGPVDSTGTASVQTDAAPEEAPVDVSVPGGGIVVVGRRSANIEKNAPAVVSVLSAADIKRTGEGNIAGSLQRVTGLSVVGGGYVYVRGLGDRYSSALLNGSPLPSPEPLRRVVPLDIFPTNVIASTLVQKTYSVNYPGEFGGGVINLTTTAIPTESFVQVSGGGSWNTETTNKLGYTYEGGGTDWSGFDNGGRDMPSSIASMIAAGGVSGDFNTDAIKGSLSDSRFSVLQRNNHVPGNFSVALNGGLAGELGEAEVGMIFSASYGNKWRTRDSLQQAAAIELETNSKQTQRVTTDNQITVNGLIGFGAQLGEQKLRWTTLFIRDTLKRGALTLGTDEAKRVGAEYLTQDTSWFARQLIDTQIAGEFVLGPIKLDVRGSYANTQRKSPYENTFLYSRLSPTSPFLNPLNNADGSAQISFSDLNENLWSGGVDASYPVTPDIKLTAGYAYTDTQRDSSRYDFRIQANGGLSPAIQLLRPDYIMALVSQAPSLFNVQEATPGNLTLYKAGLRVHGGYGVVNAQIIPSVSINAGVRYESGKQRVSGFSSPDAQASQTNRLNKNYWLPAATLTWEVQPQMQVRLSGSRTVARPQFRELIAQTYADTESTRLFRGNNYLTDSTLWNADLRYEWYFARDQRITAAAFYKSIDKPIEAYANFTTGSEIITSFANAPKATLYGAEIEAQKYVPLDGFGGSAFESRRLVLIANYTYTKSKLKVGADDVTLPYTYGGTGPGSLASIYFQDGSPMTGQSDHLGNLQIGLEDTEKLSQQTFLISYASDRVTSRGPSGQPDIKERPGMVVDFVARQGVTLGGIDAELKLEARNITGRKYQEFQKIGNRRVYWNLYDIGTSIAGSISVKF